MWSFSKIHSSFHYCIDTTFMTPQHVVGFKPSSGFARPQTHEQQLTTSNRRAFKKHRNHAAPRVQLLSCLDSSGLRN